MKRRIAIIFSAKIRVFSQKAVKTIVEGIFATAHSQAMLWILLSKYILRQPICKIYALTHTKFLPCNL